MGERHVETRGNNSYAKVDKKSNLTQGKISRKGAETKFLAKAQRRGDQVSRKGAKARRPGFTQRRKGAETRFQAKAQRRGDQVARKGAKAQRRGEGTPVIFFTAFLFLI